MAKPAVEALRSHGVQIVSAELTGSRDVLVKILQGQDVVISAIHFTAIPEEIPLLYAAEAAGVKRFVPCFFATVAPRGVMVLRDEV